jgi:hypothetical protein
MPDIPDWFGAKFRRVRRDTQLAVILRQLVLAVITGQPPSSDAEFTDVATGLADLKLKSKQGAAIEVAISVATRQITTLFEGDPSQRRVSKLTKLK